MRPYAVSDFCGKASFAIPRRTLDEASHWGKGTSAVGFLGNMNNLESIEVDVTRLDNECEEGFDFIKLDLQGGERKALQGLGDKLTRAKLIYAEHQLLRDPQDGALNWLLECGFTCFFDRLQIGVRTNVGEIPISLLIELGIVVDRLLLPDIRGVGEDYMLFGYFDSSSSSLGLSGLLSPAIVNDLMSAGVYYSQTDVIAFRPSYLNRLLRTL